MVIRVVDHLFSHSAFFWSVPRPSSRTFDWS
jgi:hypothetical protein